MKNYRIMLRKKISDADWIKYSIHNPNPIDDNKKTLAIDRRSLPRFPWDYPRPLEETHICSVFGCGKRLSPTESLFGDRCIDHSKWPLAR